MDEPRFLGVEGIVREQGPFLERLARSLVGDRERALDLVQDTWAAAVARPAVLAEVAGKGEGGLRAWLSVILRRRSLSVGRAQALRRTQEVPEGSAAMEAGPAQVAIRLERPAHDVLMDLDEPYRSALVLRFQDDLSAAEIGRRLGVPASTVRSQVTRGLAQLCAELDRRHPGGRAEWTAALLPLGYPQGGIAFASSGVASGVAAGSKSPFLALSATLAMKKHVLAGVVMLAGFFLVRASLPDGGVSFLAGAEPAEEESLLVAPGDKTQAEPGPDFAKALREPAVGRGVAGDLPRVDLPANEGETISGRIILMDGTAVSGETVRARANDGPDRAPDHSGRSGESGEFAITGLEPGTYDVGVNPGFEIENAIVPGVPAPTDSVEIRLDAVLLRVHLPEGFDRDRLKGGGVHSVARIGDAEYESSSRTYGGLQLDQDGRAQELLPAGPGYMVMVGLSDGEHLAGLLPAGAPSGVYDVELVSGSPALAAVEVVLTGAPLVSPGRVSVYPNRIIGGGKDMAFVSLSLEEGQDRARIGVLLPGEYRLETRVFGPPPSAWLLADLKTESLTLGAGDSATVEVELVQGGGLALTLESLSPAGKERFKLQLWDEVDETWRSHLTYYRAGENYSVSDPSEFGTNYRSFQPLPVGETRFRLRGKGFRTVETKLHITAGQLTEWKTVLERLP